MADQAELHHSLKNGTKREHEMAEKSPFIQKIIHGRMSKELYRIFLADLYYIYQALEEEGERNKDHPVFGPMYFPVELNRCPSIEKDLVFYFGSDWKSQIECTPAAKAYVEHIHTLGKEDPSLLVPHSYARYLGDLSGGQILKYKLQKCLQLPTADEGLWFYEFDDVYDVKKFKAFYSSRMNSLEMPTETRTLVETEAKKAFKFNIDLFAELHQIALSMRNGYIETEKEKEAKAKAAKVEENGQLAEEKDLHHSLKSGTMKEHQSAENMPFIKHIIHGRITRDIYRLFLADLYFVYEALEKEAEKNKDHPVFGPMYFPVELNRVPALEKDLVFFFGDDWRSEIHCNKAASAYVKRIHELGETDPALLVSHAYARYLGDLSGGQILKYKLQKCMNLDKTGDGVRFYEFDEIDDVKKFKTFYTSRMNSLEVDAPTRARIEDEARMAFKYNIDVFAELDQIASEMPNGYNLNAKGKSSDVENPPKSAEEPDLHKSLKSGTMKEHQSAENMPFIKHIIHGTITRKIYRIFLADLYYVYTALEEEARRNKDHPVFGPMYFPVELNRKATIEKDLEFYYGKDWQSDIKCTKAAQVYADRIRELGQSDPALLVSHAYARYLGDISGGQILKYKLQKCLDLSKEGEGVHFYEFNEISDIKKFKSFYTGRMNSLEVGSEERKRIEEEARMAFQYNIRLFAELDDIAKNMTDAYATRTKDKTPSEEQPDLHQSLKSGTMKEHQSAENMPFIKQIIHGRITRESYRLFLADLYFVYRALEEEGERNKAHPVFGPMYFPVELTRLPSIEKDLEFYYGEHWKKAITCTPAAQQYASRIRELGQNDPALLVSHAYARYLGDISGGQILKYKIQKCLQLSDGEGGVAFYDFGEIDDIKKFKSFYTGRMNNLDMDSDTRSSVQQEAKEAFQYNIRLFAELDEICKSMPSGYSAGKTNKGEDMSTAELSMITKPILGIKGFTLEHLWQWMMFVLLVAIVIDFV